ncbi:MAG: RluA family pseudouridine synthase [Pseudomonadota bacterium]
MTRNRPVPSMTEHERSYVKSIIIYEDEAILAFNKPSGLPSQVRGNRARNLDHLLWAFARSNGKRPRLVHRLDIGTSGVILAARTKPDAAALSESLSRRTAHKTYHALVSGTLPKAESGVIDTPIARLEEGGRSRVVAGHPAGKSAQTQWSIVSRAGDFALMALHPETGRMHQLRVHLSHQDCPILGDPQYGGARAARLCLHATEIMVPHPRTDEPFRVSASLPKDFLSVARAHGLDCSIFETDASG